MSVTKIFLVAFLAAQAAAAPLNARADVAEPRDAGDIDTDFAYFSFKREAEAKKAAEKRNAEAEPEAAAGDIDTDFAYFSFKREAEEKKDAEIKRDSQKKRRAESNNKA
ncbi:hypothetical protein CI238_12401 [Colletotrichum incanum]|uniref:Uncharacterized protein n=1 Tax=Colletotrichum incanum TaxID=1573173 RepID=A0A161W1J2_COLIC|nr:hypothetical protein CI238_12401 [Colletotrichum incanum]